MKIELGQLEDTDIPLLRDFLNSKYAQNLGFHGAYSAEFLNQNIENIWGENAYSLTIKTQAEGDFKKGVSGFCALRRIDWVARHAELVFIITNLQKNIVTISEWEEAEKAFLLLLDYGFDELNLNKLWMEVYQGLDIKGTLESYGFVAEGVRRHSKQINGKQVSTTIYSLLYDQYRRQD